MSLLSTLKDDCLTDSSSRIEINNTFSWLNGEQSLLIEIGVILEIKVFCILFLANTQL